MNYQNNYNSPLGAVGFYRHSGPTIQTLKKDDFHTLSSEEKKMIFRKNAPLHARARGKGTAILKSLQTLAPSVPSRFELKLDPIDKLTMRVWRPKSSKTDRPDSYICLSYCWSLARSSNVNQSEVSLPISEIMFSAFAAQRTSDRTGLWIDQLCIDQRNSAEKAMSVSAMDAVYRCAERVVVILHDVWLPLAQQNFLRSQFEANGDGWWYDPRGLFRHSTDSPPYFEKYPMMKRMLYIILESRYFTRAWCSHELQMRGKYVFCMPCQPTYEQSDPEVFHFGSDFLLYLILLSSKVPSEMRVTSTEHERIKEVKEKLIVTLKFDNPINQDRMTVLAESEQISPRAMPSYPARIREIFSLGAGGDPDLPSTLRASSAILDKTTIVLNILDNGLSIKRTQNQLVNEDECIEDLYMVGLAANDPLTLCSMGQHLNFGHNGKRLSWLRQPAYVDLGCGTQRDSPLPCMIPQLTQRIQIDQSPERRWIEVDVFALGPPSVVEARFRALAQDLLDKCLSLDMGRAPFQFSDRGADPVADFVGKTDVPSHLTLLLHESINHWGPGPEYQYWFCQTVIAKWRERFVWTIACILQCGPAWILGTAERCGYPALLDVGPRLSPVLDFVNGAWDIAVLNSMSWSRHDRGKAAVNAIFSFANWAVTWGNDRAYGMRSDCVPALYAHGPQFQGYAMVYIRPDALVQIVIPNLLLEDHYARLYRAWLLEAKDDPLYENMHRGLGAEWFLRAKAILFTDVDDGDTLSTTRPAIDRTPGWRFRSQVRIHGPPQSVGDAIKAHLENMEPGLKDQAVGSSSRS